METKYISARGQGIYGRNSHDILLIGGYGVKKIGDMENGEIDYANLRTLSGWGDIQTMGKKVKYGVFCGYTINKGSGGKMSGPVYARGADIDRVCRIAPRIVYEKQPISISLEGEYTTAHYGNENGDFNGRVTDAKAVSNFRTLLSVKYFF